jgi:hypothetical protein
MMLVVWGIGKGSRISLTGEGDGRCSFLSGCGTVSINAFLSWTLTAALGKGHQDLSVSNIY